MKQKSNQKHSQAGFTLVELLTVLGITSLLLSALVIDFAGQRGKRNIVLAKNEVVTNLRKVQSYMLSAKNITPGVPAKYYIATFQDGATNFTVQAVDKDYKYYDNIETVNLPSKVNISTLAVPLDDDDKNYQYEKFVYDYSGGEIETESEDNGDGGGTETTIVVDDRKIQATAYPCMQIIFSAPFGKMQTRGASKCYESVVNVLKDPVQISKLNQKSTYIYFTETGSGTGYSYLEIQPITGQMTIH